MSIYSGFPTRKDEEKYNSLLSKLILALQAHLIELLPDALPHHKLKNYAKIINRMKAYEEHKYLPPKFTNLLTPLVEALGLDALLDQKMPIHLVQPPQLLKPPSKLSSRSLQKQKFNLPNYNSGTEAKAVQLSPQHQFTEGSLLKKMTLKSSSSKLSRPKVSKGVFPIGERQAEVGQKGSELGEQQEHWQTFSKEKIAKEGQFRYRAYQALQEAQSNVNKRSAPLREEMRKKLRTEGEPSHQTDY